MIELSDKAQALIAALVHPTADSTWEVEEVTAAPEVWKELREKFPLRLADAAIEKGDVTIESPW
jgi:hypothetical protein